ncbi:MAG: hypothetical protein HOA40_03225 [Porticoccaceae bacterium]|nr:hypothetical protein [Porticoccaceae bacterium]MBT6798561.1 hypothetical protein [Porticoccaceae bacterium]MBT7167613.1 hypothetical protein [Porticoccaceae bacterium]
MSTRIDAHFVTAGKYHDIDFARLEILKLLAEHTEIRTTVACDLPGIQDFYPNPEKCAWNYPVYYELLRRGILWAKRSDVSKER